MCPGDDNCFPFFKQTIFNEIVGVPYFCKTNSIWIEQGCEKIRKYTVNKHTGVC